MFGKLVAIVPMCIVGQLGRRLEETGKNARVASGAPRSPRLTFTAVALLASNSMAVSIGTQLRSYEITELLGKGGMGEVYRGRDLKLKRDVAIKILPDEFSRDSDRLSRFQREAEVLASLNHPNIGAIYDLEEAGQTRFLVLELVEGETLAERIQRGPVPVEEALDIAKHIAEALEAAHEKGVIHRDLKPANVKITSDGRVKVLDFGLAKAVDEGPISATASNSPTLSLAATQAGVILGTAAYMSPEQARGRAVDKRSDIWAFGVVLYEMLTGEQLFQGDTVSDILASVLRHEIDWKRVSPKAARLLRRCLERDPRLRLRDIGDIHLLLEDEPQEAAVSASRSSWRLGLTGWAIAVFLIVLGLASWGLRSPQLGDLPLIRLKTDPGPNFSATGFFSAILSPDETRLLYRVRTSEGKYFLAIRPLDQEKETLLPQTENPSGTPFFSADGRWFAFFSGGKMKKIPVQGGSVTELCDCQGAGTGSWGEDGSIVFPLSSTSGLSRVSEMGGKPEPLTVLVGTEVTHRYPQVLPGAKAVLYTATSSIGNFDTATIQVASLKTGKPKTLVTGGYFGRYVPSNGRRGHVIYINQGRLFAIPFDPERLETLGTAQAVLNGIFSNSVSGSGRFDVSTQPSPSGKFIFRDGDSVDESKWAVLWVDAAGKTSPLIAAPGNYGSMRLSQDGRRLAFTTRSEKGSDLFVYDSTLDRMYPLTFNGEAVGSPVWAPDGKHLVFRSKDGMSWIRADGGGELQLLLPGQNTPSSFSPDGKHLAYYPIGAGTDADIWILPFEFTDPDHPKLQKPELFLNSSAGESLPAFSPDGHWIAYRVSMGSGEQSVWVRPFHGPGGRWQISTDATFPMWSRTSSQLFFERTDGEIMVVDYTVSGDSFIAKNPRPWSPRRAFQPNAAINIDIAPDGKRFVIFDRPVGAPEAPTHLTFLLNFFAELRRRAPEGK